MYHTKNEILSFLKQLKPELASQGIISLGLFGSIAKETNNEASDIDIVYETSNFFFRKAQRLECLHLPQYPIEKQSGKSFSNTC